MEMQYKRYNEKAEYSYCFGPFPTFELLENRPERAVEVLYHSAVTDAIREKLLTPARRRNVREVTSGCRTGRPYIPLYAAMESMLTIGFSIKQI